MYNLYVSANRLHVPVVVFHNAVPDSVIKAHSTEWVSFVKVTPIKHYSTNDFRFLVYKNYLRTHAVSAVLMVDASDVFFNANPFSYTHGHTIFVAPDTGTFHANAWQVKHCYGEIAQSWNQTVKMHNAGVWGGQASMVQCVLKCIARQLVGPLRDKGNCNMPALNWCVNHGHCGAAAALDNQPAFVNPFRKDCRGAHPIIHNKCSDTEGKVCVDSKQGHLLPKHGACSNAATRSPTCAIVTYLSSAGLFEECAATCAYSAAQQTPGRPVLVLLTPALLASSVAKRLAAGGATVGQIDLVKNPNRKIPNKHFENNYAVLEMWKLTQYDRVIAIDADMLVTQSLDSLCTMPLAAGQVLAANNWWTHKRDWDPNVFNGGLLVLRPSLKTYEDLIAKSRIFVSPSGGVQPFLNYYFSGNAWGKLDPRSWGANANSYSLRPETWNTSAVRAIHYTINGNIVKPCYSKPGTYASAKPSHPYAQWHAVHNRLIAKRDAPTRKQIDVVVVSGTVTCVLRLVTSRLQANLANIGAVHVIVPAHFVETCKDIPNVTCHNENLILPRQRIIDAHSHKNKHGWITDKDKAPWYYQQYLKLFAYRFLNLSSQFMVWDADNILLKSYNPIAANNKHRFVTGGWKTNTYTPSLTALTGITNPRTDIVVHQMIIDKVVLNALVSHICGLASAEECVYAIVGKIPANAHRRLALSEYSTYFNWLYTHNKQMVLFDSSIKFVRSRKNKGECDMATKQYPDNVHMLILEIIIPMAPSTSAQAGQQHRVLVTGGAGFIGMHTCLRLHAQGHHVVAYDNLNEYYDPKLKTERVKQLQGIPFVYADVCNASALANVIASHNIDRIIHLAAQAGVRYSIGHPHEYIRNNVDCFVTLLEAIKTKQIPLVYASSSSVYGTNTKVPFAEHDPVERPASLYAATKRSNELIATVYHNIYGQESIGLRFFTVYGPWGRPDMAYWSFTKNIVEGNPIRIFNHGHMERDFTYIDDVVDGIQASMHTRTSTPLIFNLGSCRPTPLSVFIRSIETSLGKTATTEELDMQPGDVPRTYADITQAKLRLGYNPSTPLSVGIARFTKWYLSQYRRAF